MDSIHHATVSSDAEHDGLVLLTTARDNVDAMGIRSVLEAEGIHVFVQGEHHRAMEGMLGIFVELRVMVPRSQLDDARELLEEAAYAEHLPPETEPVDEEVDDRSIGRFRDRASEAEASSASAETDQPRRHPGLALLLSVLIPLGAGHFYAGRRKTAAILGTLLVIDWILFAQGWNVTVAVIFLVMFDALGSIVAINRANARASMD